jgi:hypothetical protein
MIRWKASYVRWSVTLSALVAFAVASGAGARWN